MAEKKWFIGSATDWGNLTAPEQAVYEGTHTNLTLWESIEAYDLEAAGDTAIAEVFGTIAQGSTRFLQNGWTTDAANYCIIRARAGQEYDHVADTGAKVTFTTNFCFQVAAANKTIVEDVSAETNNSRLFSSLAADQLTVDRCKLEALTVVCDDSTARIFRNCLVVNIDADSSAATVNNGTHENCVFLVTSARGATTGGAGTTLTNCVVYNATTSTPSFDEIQGTQIACASSDASASSGLINITSAEFEDYAGGDYHLASDSKLISAGANLYTSFTKDIDGDTWPQYALWDIGADYQGGIGLVNKWASETIGGTSVAVTLNNVTSGNILIAVLIKEDDEATTGPTEDTWTLIDGIEQANNIFHEVWKREADGTEATQTWTGGNEDYALDVFELDGTVYDYATITMATMAAGTTAAPISPTITPGSDGSFVLAGFGADDDDTPYIIDSQLTILTTGGGHISTTGNGTCGQAVGYLIQPTAGATGAFTHSQNASEEWVAWSLYIEPASGGISQSVGLITESETLFSASVITDQSIAVSLLTENETLFQSNVIFDQSIGTGLLSESESLFSPSSIVEQLIAIGLLTESEALFTATPLPGELIQAVGQLNENESLFPAASIIEQLVSTGLLTENESLFTASPLTGDSILVGQINENESLFSATALPGILSKLVGSIAESEILFTTTPLLGGSSIVVGQLSETETLFSATVLPGVISETTGLLSENESLFAATPSTGDLIAVGLITESESLLSPNVSTTHTITVGLINESEILFSAAPQNSVSISVGQLTEAENLFSASALPGELLQSVGQITEAETLFSVILGAVTLGGVYNATAYFGTGQTVNIELYDPVTGDVISTTDSSCPEIGSTGLYIWDNSKLTAQPAGYQEYSWRMTDGTNFDGGIINMFDTIAATRIQELWQRLGLDSSNPVKTNDDNSIQIGPDGVPIIEIDAVNGSSDTVQTRQ